MADQPMWEDPETGELVPRVWKSFVDRRIPFTELDDEELARMQVKNKDGRFVGGKPKMVPQEIAQGHAQELVRRNNSLLKDVLLKATQVHIDIMLNEDADPGLRMKAAQYLQDRLLGKAPDKMEIKAEVKPWEGLVSGILKSEE